MIEIAEAQRLIAAAAVVLPPRRIRLEDAAGQQLQADVVADVDSPPWDRAMMDGFAVSAADFPIAPAPADAPDTATEIIELDVAAERAAGDAAGLNVRSGQCVRIMTGAPVPPGADAIVPIERAIDGTATAHAGNRVRLQDPRFRIGQHIARQGDSFRAGQTVLRAGVKLAAPQLGLAAEAGGHHVVVSAPPRVAIIATGSELVPAGVVPTYGQTRNSNGPMLAAAVNESGAEAIPLGIAADRPESLRAAIAQGLAADVLLLSGGVSAGDYDLVPGALAAAGVEQIFHKVRLKPGKPIWFGIFRRAAAAPTLVYGLPGNPVSSLVCFELFVRPALATLAGRPAEKGQRPALPARLLAAVKGNANRPVYHPCSVVRATEGLTAEPLPWGGSADLLGLSRANGLMLVPAGRGELAVGETVTVLPFDLSCDQPK
jgi:molybdopterin molybdotransferase